MMTGESPELPNGDRGCIALYKESSKADKSCKWPAKILKDNLLCLRHAKALKRDPKWPLRENFEESRDQILEDLKKHFDQETESTRQASSSVAQEAEPDKADNKSRVMHEFG